MTRRGRWLEGAVAAGLVAVLTVPFALALADGPDAVTGPPQGATASALGRTAPPLAGPTLDGGRLDLADLRGSVVLVNVWASWCAPCREEMPLLAETARELGPRGLRVVGLASLDREPDARAFLASVGEVPFPSVADPEGRLALDWGTVGLPETLVVDRQGTVVAKSFGAVTPAWIDTHVRPLLEGP